MALVALGAFFVAAPVASAQDLFNCDSFSSQAEAQAEYDRDTRDPHGLDGPPGPTSAGQPGVACEEEIYPDQPVAPGLPAPDVTAPPGDGQIPDGSVDTGFGGMADQSSTSTQPPWLLVGGAMAAGVSALALRRRRALHR
ncbi:hypothetical protein PO878_14710 [Iamia majanohamensis]|uniref:Uncharacterized protein n=1 Tax=Iamia majanohamensis TaxID=467976 RepID=A0AAF0BU67_9ACTN|nr:hypothetical protein [Iamia majanohamensis]WCO65753.1 hypothetical protein PO878_14710 [Iamia majanohamensis]